MENKYYTPTIEEFHIGFECEVLGIIGAKEDQRLFSQPTIISQKELPILHLIEIRVKYLDKSDIESLGWDHDLGSPGRYEYKDYVLYNFNNSNIFTIKIKRSFIKYTENFVSFDILFEGTIKNKSQLKFIMTCLGILE